jgi:membrane protease YdiL (CAAX protease family)
MGGLFVILLVLLLFLLDGDGYMITWFSSSLANYVPIVEQILSYLVIVGFATFAMNSEGIRRSEIGISRRHFLESLPLLAALGVATTLVAWLGNNWPKNSISTQSGLDLPLPVVIIIVFVVAVAEEYVFRGYVQVGTQRRFGVTAALVVSGIVFAISHIPTDIAAANVQTSASIGPALPSLLFAFTSRFAFGVMAFSAMYQLVGNMFITIFTHAFYDFSVVYYTPVGGSITVILVCLALPYVVVGLMQLRRAGRASIRWTLT